MKNILVVLFLLAFSSCGILTSHPPFIIEANRVSSIFIDQVTKKYCYKAYGIGGAFPDQINGFLFDFATWEKVSPDQAEIDIHEIYAMLSKLIDSDESIRPYLSEWPFKGKETRIDIMFFDSSTGKLRRAPEVSVIGIKTGEMYKFYTNPQTGRLMDEDEYQKYLDDLKTL